MNRILYQNQTCNRFPIHYNLKNKIWSKKLLSWRNVVYFGSHGITFIIHVSCRYKLLPGITNFAEMFFMSKVWLVAGRKCQRKLICIKVLKLFLEKLTSTLSLILNWVPNTKNNILKNCFFLGIFGIEIP